MRKVVWLVVALVVIGVAGTTNQAAAQNNTAATAITVVPDGSTRSGTLAGGQSAWFVAPLKAGHSYVITGSEGNVRGTSHTGSFVSGFISLSLYQSDGSTTLTGMTFTGDANPAVRVYDPTLGSNHYAGSWRYSYAPLTTGNIFLQVQPLYATDSTDWVYFRLSVIDTTLGCTWYYTSTDYESFMEVTNTSDMSVTFTAQHYSSPTSSGASVSPVGNAYTFTLVPNATTLVGARATANVPAGNRGGAKITHNGPPGAIKANITTINITGLGLTHSFNTACEPAFAHPTVDGAY